MKSETKPHVFAPMDLGPWPTPSELYRLSEEDKEALRRIFNAIRQDKHISDIITFKEDM